MRPAQAWKKLGIGKTTDRREIKRAYAGKLKAIDPDSDPEAFLSLREALETALWQSEAVAGYEEIDYAEPEGPIVGGHRPELAEAGSENTEQSEVSEDRRHRLADILLGDMPIQPLEAEAVELAGLILGNSQMENIEYRSEIEDWLAWLIATTIGRSDCVIPTVVGYFGWKAEVGHIYSDHMVETVVGRYDDIVLLAALQRPEHVDHRSFMRLSSTRTGPPGFLERNLHGTHIANFIARIRERNPTVEWGLNADTVALWESKIGHVIGSAPDAEEGRNRYIILFLVIFLSIVLRAIMQ